MDRHLYIFCQVNNTMEFTHENKGKWPHSLKLVRLFAAVA